MLSYHFIMLVNFMNPFLFTDEKYLGSKFIIEIFLHE